MCVLGRQTIFGEPKLARIALGEIIAHRSFGWYWLHAYAIMPDHVHLLIKLIQTGRSLGRTIGVLKSAILHKVRRNGADFQWQESFYDRILRDGDDGAKIAAYILANPERARLVAQGEAYPFCGIVDRYW
jgi:putative transposase